MHLGPRRQIRYLDLHLPSSASSPLDRPRAFFTPLATVHRDLSAWSRDLVDAYRLGWDDAMTAVAEGLFHIDDAVRECNPSAGPPRS